MAQGGAVISNLQSALDCLGKCDCCENLQQQINSLNQRINALDGKFIPKAEKPQIISESVDRSYNLILPESKGYTDTKFTLLDLAITALKALFELFSEEMEARQKAIKAALDAINAVVEQLKKLLSLPARVDKLEQDILRINPELARLLGLIKKVERTADTALANSQRALEVAVEARFLANKAIGDVKELEGFTKAALQRIEAYIKSEINKVNSRIDGVVKTVDEQSARIAAIIQRLLRIEALMAGFQAQIDALISQLNALRQKVAVVEAAIKNVYGLLFQALQQIDALELRLDEANRRIDEAISKGIQAIRKADDAISKGIQAIRKADDAISKANNAEKLARSIKGELESKIKELQAYFEGKINALSSEIFGLNLVASTALSVAQNSLGASQLALNKANRLEQTKQDKGGLPFNDLDKRFNDFVASNNKALGIKDLNLSNLSKDFDKRLSDFQRLSTLDANKRFNEFVAANNQALNIRDLQTSNLSKDFDQQLRDFERLSKLNADERFGEFLRSNEQSLGGLKLKDREHEGRLNKLESPTINPEINDLKRRLGEQEKMNKEGNDKLDKMLPLISTIPLIPGKVADGLRPSIPTVQQIGTEVGKVNCRSLQSGCGRKAIDDQTNAINNVANANKGDLLNKLSAGANAGQLALLTKIDGKLGAQIAGGISGKLQKGFEWLQIDRALNLLTFIATVHNGFQLSSAIVETLGQAISNGLQLIGIKGDDGQAINISSLIGTTVNSALVTIVGAENATAITTTWAKANRIYQASSNVLNNLMNVNSIVTNALEVIGSYTGKIGNALRLWGVVGEKAYSWMNPQPSFDNKWTTKLEQLGTTASTVQMISQIPLDTIQATTELNNSFTEFTKAIKEEPETKKGIDVGEASQTKAKIEASKAVSQPNPFDFSDLFDGEDL